MDATSGRNQDDRFDIGFSRSFDSLVSQYEARVIGFLLRLLRSAEEVEETWHRLCSRLESGSDALRNDSQTLTWVFQNALVAAEEVLVEKSTDSSLQVTIETSAAGLCSGVDAPAGMIDDLVSRMTHEYRQVFLLHDVEGFSSDVISGILNLPLEDVKERIHRSRLMARRIMRRSSLPAEGEQAITVLSTGAQAHPELVS